MKIGDEVIIIGESRYNNGYPINSIGYIFSIEDNIDGFVFIVTSSWTNKNWDWFGYTAENIKLSKSQIRVDKLNSIL